MSVVRWTFYDGTNTYTFPVNPNEGGSPQRQRTLTELSPTAPQGRTIMFEGPEKVQSIDIKGTILEQIHFEAFNAWFDKRQQIRITDDLGRQFWVMFEDFKPTRARTVHWPWRHNYSATFKILSWSPADGGGFAETDFELLDGGPF